MLFLYFIPMIRLWYYWPELYLLHLLVLVWFAKDVFWLHFLKSLCICMYLNAYTLSPIRLSLPFKHDEILDAVIWTKLVFKLRGKYDIIQRIHRSQYVNDLPSMALRRKACFKCSKKSSLSENMIHLCGYSHDSVSLG